LCLSFRNQKDGPNVQVRATGHSTGKATKTPKSHSGNPVRPSTRQSIISSTRARANQSSATSRPHPSTSTPAKASTGKLSTGKVLNGKVLTGNIGKNTLAAKNAPQPTRRSPAKVTGISADDNEVMPFRNARIL